MSAGTVLVTGAAGGIGAACAERFLRAGWTVYGWDLTNIAEPRIRATRIDLTSWDDVHAAAPELPPLQALVNAVGVASREPAAALTREEWLRVIDANLNAPFFVVHACYTALREARGTIVNIASITASVGFRNRSVYSATKAAVVALTRNLALEWAPDGIRVIAVSPTFTRTPLVQKGIDEGKTNIDVLLERTPQHRLLEPDELAAVIFRLVSPDFAGLTGSEVVVDCGLGAFGGF